MICIFVKAPRQVKFVQRDTSRTTFGTLPEEARFGVITTSSKPVEAQLSALTSTAHVQTCDVLGNIYVKLVHDHGRTDATVTGVTASPQETRWCAQHGYHYCIYLLSQNGQPSVPIMNRTLGFTSRQYARKSSVTGGWREDRYTVRSALHACASAVRPSAV